MEVFNDGKRIAKMWATDVEQGAKDQIATKSFWFSITTSMS